MGRDRQSWYTRANEAERGTVGEQIAFIVDAYIACPPERRAVIFDTAADEAGSAAYAAEHGDAPLTLS